MNKRGNYEIKRFETEDEAYDYAETLGKYEFNKVLVGNKPAFVSSTDIPIETRFRYPIEEIVRNFCIDEMGIEDEDFIDDMANEIGADICGELTDMIEKRIGVKFISAYLCY